MHSSHTTNTGATSESRAFFQAHLSRAPWSGRAVATLRWLGSKARRLLRRLGFPGMGRTSAYAEWYKELYRNLSERALQSGQPGECVPELMLYDMEGNRQQLSRFWDQQPALVVTMSLSCGQSRRHAPVLQRLSRRFERHINTVIIYVVEAHPIDAPSPYSGRMWVTTRNEMAGIRCAQPRTIECRIQLAHHMRRRFRLSSSILIDDLDNCVWRAFGHAPNVAILVHPGGRIAYKQGLFEAKEMTREITTLLGTRL